MAVHPNDKYGRLIVLRRGEDYLYRGQKQPRWVCKCACGNEILVRACHLLSGNTQSCGCLRRTRNQSRPHKVQYVFHNDYVECRLTNGISFLIDLSDYARVCLYGWSYNRPRDYVFCNAAHMKQIPLSRFLLNCPHDMEVDHINHNRLDNRRCNLRIASKSQNRANRRPGKNSTTGYIGVSYCKQTKKWRASIVGAVSYTHLDVYKRQRPFPVQLCQGTDRGEWRRTPRLAAWPCECIRENNRRRAQGTLNRPEKVRIFP